MYISKITFIYVSEHICNSNVVSQFILILIDLLVSIELPNYMEKENIDTFEVKITASVPASFDYNVTVTTIQGTAFGKKLFYLL